MYPESTKRQEASNGVQVKQVQGVGAALVAGHGQFVQPGSVRFACQGDGVGYLYLVIGVRLQYRSVFV